jgi:hypothetical protein
VWPEGRLLGAIQRFNESDDVQLLSDEKADNGKVYGSVGERAITHRFAVHLEQEFRDKGYPSETVKLAFDCEYNRHRGAIKAHLVKGEMRERVEAAKKKLLRENPEKKGWYVFTILPDIIVHERGDDNYNLLVVELKRASNTVDNDLDNLKLRLFTTQDYMDGYGYVVGASIIA